MLLKSVVSVGVLSACITLSAFADADTQVQVQASEIAKQERALDNSFFQQQVQQSMSPGRTVRTLIGHYPQSATSIVDIALDLYPERYKEIIHSAVSALPSSAEDIVTIAVNKGITECESIVEAAIKAEPSYVSFVATAAANASPEDFNDILRVAVMTEPDSADKIVQHMATSFPEKIAEILSNTIKHVPLVGEYIVDALLAVFPNKAEEVVSVAVRESSADRQQIERIIATALDAGVTQIDVTRFASMGGATDAEITAGVGHSGQASQPERVPPID